jgi:plastocyanin
MKRFVLLLAAGCLVAVFATACGGSSSTSEQSKSGTAAMSASPTAATGAPAAATITIANMDYGQPVTVPPGAQIALKNNDTVEHSVTSDAAGKFSVDVDGGEQGTLTAPTEPGQYAFHCKYHPSMHGTLTVA